MTSDELYDLQMAVRDRISEIICEMTGLQRKKEELERALPLIEGELERLSIINRARKITASSLQRIA